MRRRGLLVLMFVLAAAGVVHAQQQWVEHRPVGAGYRIEFPGRPTVESQEVDTGAGNGAHRQSEHRQGRRARCYAQLIPEGHTGRSDGLTRQGPR